eukprot:11620124-Alexandrium_andersonii.AAC.1
MCIRDRLKGCHLSNTEADDFFPQEGAWLVEPSCERRGRSEIHQLQRPGTGMAAKAVAAEEIPAGCVALTMWADTP